MRHLFIFVLSAFCLGCDSRDNTIDGGTGGGGADEQVCSKESTDTSESGVVKVCEEAFAVAPLVRVPADVDADDGTRLVYGGITHDPSTRALVFAGRGVQYPISSQSDWLAHESMYGNVRYGYFIYRARVRGTTVETVTPAVRIDDRVFQRLLLSSVYEGLASPRMVDTSGNVRFGFDMQNIGLRIRIDDEVQSNESDRLVGYPRYALLGRIENAHQAIRASDGGCLSSLSSFGIQNPLFSAVPGENDNRVEILRHPNMHGGNDDVFTWSWPTALRGNMGIGLFVSPADLIQDTAPILDSATNHPHATPWAGPSANLTKVQGGGESCTP